MSGVAGIVLGVLLFIDAKYQFLAAPLLIVWSILLITESNRNQELERTIKDLRVELRNKEVKLESLENQAKQSVIVPVPARIKTLKPSIKAKVNEPDKAKIAKVKTKRDDVIIPRVVITSATNSKPENNYVSGRDWSQFEIKKLLMLYKGFSSAAEMSVALEREPKEVVVKLAEVVYGLSGDLEDISQAPNNQGPWSRERRLELGTRFKSGETIDSLAKRFGRTRLAIVWQLINIRVGENQ